MPALEVGDPKLSSPAPPGDKCGYTPLTPALVGWQGGEGHDPRSHWPVTPTGVCSVCPVSSVQIDASLSKKGQLLHVKASDSDSLLLLVVSGAFLKLLTLSDEESCTSL